MWSHTTPKRHSRANFSDVYPHCNHFCIFYVNSLNSVFILIQCHCSGLISKAIQITSLLWQVERAQLRRGEGYFLSAFFPAVPSWSIWVVHTSESDMKLCSVEKAPSGWEQTRCLPHAHVCIASVVCILHRVTASAGHVPPKKYVCMRLNIHMNAECGYERHPRWSQMETTLGLLCLCI